MTIRTMTAGIFKSCCLPIQQGDAGPAKDAAETPASPNRSRLQARDEIELYRRSKPAHSDLRRYSASRPSSAASSQYDARPALQAIPAQVTIEGEGSARSSAAASQAEACANTAGVASACVGKPAKKALSRTVFKYAHPEHGSLEIRRLRKREDKSLVNFHISLTTPEGNEIKHKHFMFVSDEDESRNNKSTLGYVNIELPEPMRGKGIAYAYHHAAAATAKELGVNFFSIDAVLKAPMIAACRGMNMRSGYEEHNYECEPDALANSTREKLAGRNWDILTQ